MVHAVHSRRAVLPAGETDAVIVVRDERIAAVLTPAGFAASEYAHVPCEQLGDTALLPGLVDAHTHINEPGRTEWEGFATATRAAAAGGFTTLVDMPLNNLPETTDVHALELKRAAARGQCMVDVAFWGGVVPGNAHELAPLAAAGVRGFKCFLIYPGCDGLCEIDLASLDTALPTLAQTGLPLLVHAELAGPIDDAVATLNARGADWRAYATYLASRPDEAELAAIRALLGLCMRHRFRLHIVHLSAAAALPLLAHARREGLPVTVETCPHYLHATAEEIADGATLWKCAPPIRSAANREALWQGLRDGTIDLIATDHSPCPPAMKRLHATQPGEEAGRFDEAWGGIASLAVALPVVWTAAAARGFSLADIARWMAHQPAQLAGLDAQLGSIAPGKQASFVAFDADAYWLVSAGDLHQRHAISPYVGAALRGRVCGTWLRGSKVWNGSSKIPNGSSFAAQCTGREPAT